MHETPDGHVEVRVLAEHFLGVLVGVERVHQDQGNVGAVGFVQVLEKTTKTVRWKYGTHSHV